MDGWVDMRHERLWALGWRTFLLFKAPCTAWPGTVCPASKNSPCDFHYPWGPVLLVLPGLFTACMISAADLQLSPRHTLPCTPTPIQWQWDMGQCRKPHGCLTVTNVAGVWHWPMWRWGLCRMQTSRQTFWAGRCLVTRAAVSQAACRRRPWSPSKLFDRWPFRRAVIIQRTALQGLPLG